MNSLGNTATMVEKQYDITVVYYLVNQFLAEHV